ncbi:hypothetical protein GH714_031203 [Hevea brasiliensis]|uniref:Phosphatidylinositol-specific phospholipase C X domain-containing protein n=1 Tax=Hevea brasiliensis TaxID=3981 RepID=A0A6A6LH04_HEVBR|nr:hypothetical protein GH714_031203 [Hevea brasiliensis]
MNAHRTKIVKPDFIVSLAHKDFQNNSLPFNKYAFLTTHNAYAIDGYPSHTGVPRVTFTNQEDSVTQQLNNGARALMLDTYDFRDDGCAIHLKGNVMTILHLYGPAIEQLKEIEAFLSANPSEIVTIILEDYVQAPNGLTKVFTDAGLMKYWFPVTSMPKNGQDWPLVSDMVKITRGSLCSLQLNPRKKVKELLTNGITWLKITRSEGGGSFQAVDTLNGKLLCGCDDIHACLNNSLPFNKYAFLTTHNAYAIDGYPSHTGVPRLTVTNQEDTVTQQLNNGVRALMLDTYDFRGDVWLCHSFKGHCYDYTAFGPAIDTLKEIEAFLSANPSEIVTIILEDYVQAPKGLTKVFTDAGLMKYWFPVRNMPKYGQDWPLVRDMIKNNQRLLVFTSIKSKEKIEGIATSGITWLKISMGMVVCTQGVVLIEQNRLPQ